MLAQWGAGAFGGGGRGQQQQQAQSQQPLGLALEQAPQRVPATGCGSGDWMGLAPVSEAVRLLSRPSTIQRFLWVGSTVQDSVRAA